MSNPLFDIKILNNNEVEIAGYKGDGGDVVIPEEIDGKKVVSIGDHAFCENYHQAAVVAAMPTPVIKHITSVVIPNSVKRIGDDAFYCCSELSAIEIPDSVTEVDEFAFVGCSKVKKIYIPKNLTNIKSNSFSKNVDEIVVDINNPKYDSRCNCNAIIETATNTLVFGCKNTIIPNDIEIIGKKAFCDCTELRKIVIPDSVKEIGFYTFASSGLETITISDNVQKIGAGAFCESALESVKIGAGVHTINARAFARCDNLTTIIVSEHNPKYDSRDNCNAIIFTAKRELVVGCKSTIIPEGVELIGDNAFESCIFKNIIIPEGVYVIGACAFEYSDFESIVIPDSMVKIGAHAFECCRQLSDLRLGKCVIEIGFGAFSEMESLTKLFIPKYVTRMDDAIYNCENLEEIEIEENSKLKTFGKDGIEITPKLRKIKIGKGCKSSLMRQALEYAIENNIEEMIEDEYLKRITKKDFEKVINFAREKERVSVLQDMIVKYHKRFGERKLKL